MTSASQRRADPSRLYAPRRARVQMGDEGTPQSVDGTPVDAIREEWLVEDAWWAKPLHRRYFELVLADGRDVVVFCESRAGDTASGNWSTQRA